MFQKLHWLLEGFGMQIKAGCHFKALLDSSPDCLLEYLLWHSSVCPTGSHWVNYLQVLSLWNCHLMRQNQEAGFFCHCFILRHFGVSSFIFRKLVISFSLLSQVAQEEGALKYVHEFYSFRAYVYGFYFLGICVWKF